MDVAGLITELVREGPVQGSKLAHTVRARCPEWTPAQAGARNLRDFVDRFVDGVGVVGRSGMDVIYGLSATATGEVGAESRADVGGINYWRVWVSPNSPYSLTIDRVSGDVGYRPRAGAAKDSEVTLEPAPREWHEDVAREFAERVQGEAGTTLPTVGGADGWRYAWQQSVQALGLEPAWLAYRSSALEARLRQRLGEHELSDDAKERALGQIVGDRTTRRRLAPSRVTADGRSELEAILIAVVPKMEESDLRTLKVPIGLVLDAMAQRSAQ